MNGLVILEIYCLAGAVFMTGHIVAALYKAVFGRKNNHEIFMGTKPRDLNTYMIQRAFKIAKGEE